jgi:YD repeat-containing protein
MKKIKRLEHWRLILLALVILPGSALKVSSEVLPVPEKSQALISVRTGEIASYPLIIQYRPERAIGSAGKGWAWSLDASLKQEKELPLIKISAYCNELLFLFDEKGNFSTNPATPGKLEWVNGDFNFTANTGERLYFSKDGNLKSIQHRNGNTAQINYDGKKRIKGWELKSDRIENVSFDDMLSMQSSDSGSSGNGKIDWDEHGRIKKIKNQDGIFEFKYEKELLCGISKNGKEYWFCAYDLKGRPNKINEGGRVYSLSYDEKGRLKQLQEEDGEDILLEYGTQLSDREINVWRLPAGVRTRYMISDDKKEMFIEEGPIGEKPDIFVKEDIATRIRMVETLQGDRFVMYPLPGGAFRVVSNQRGSIPKVTRVELDKLVTVNGSGAELYREMTLPSKFDRVSSSEFKNIGLVRRFDRKIVRMAAAKKTTALLKYNPEDRLESIAFPGGGTTSLSYDGEGRVKKIINADGMATCYSYGDSGKKVTEKLPDGTENCTWYLAENIPSRRLESNKRDTVYSYSDSGELSQVEMKGFDTQNYYLSPEEDLSSFNSKIFGEYIFKELEEGKVARIDSSGRAVFYFYDENGLTNLIKDENDKVLASCEFNQYRQPVKSKSSALSRELEYDKYGRLSKEKYPDWGIDLKYRYNPLGRVEMVTDNLGNTIRYVSDQVGLLNTLSDSKAGEFKLKYGWFGLPVELTRPNGIKTIWSYDNCGRLTACKHVLPGGKSIDYRYSYDSVGNIVQVKDSGNGSLEISYDGLSQVNGVKSSGSNLKVSYDNWGNVLQYGKEKVAYQVAGLPVKYGDFEVSCDPLAGVVRSGKGKDQTSFSYDWKNRLSEMVEKGQKSRWGYGPQGELASFEGAGKAKSFIYALGSLYAVKDKQGMTRYLNLPENDYCLAVIRPDGKVEYPLCEPSGSIVQLTDSKGNITGSRKFDVFGNPLGKDNLKLDTGAFGKLSFADGRILFIDGRAWSLPLLRALSVPVVEPGQTGLSDINMLSYLQGNPLSMINIFNARDNL